MPLRFGPAELTLRTALLLSLAQAEQTASPELGLAGA